MVHILYTTLDCLFFCQMEIVYIVLFNNYHSSGIYFPLNCLVGTSQRHLLVLILIPLAMLILTAGFLYRRHKIKQR